MLHPGEIERPVHHHHAQPYPARRDDRAGADQQLAQGLGVNRPLGPPGIYLPGVRPFRQVKRAAGRRAGSQSRVEVRRGHHALSLRLSASAGRLPGRSRRLTKTFRHPVVEEVTVDCDSLTLTDRDQHLVLYTAPPGSRSAEALALLNVLGTESVNAPG